MEIQKEGGPEMEIQEIASKNFIRWKNAVLSKDPRSVADGLYAKDATFLPTVSPGLLRGIEQTRGYFEHFLAKSPEGSIKEEEVQPMGDRHYCHSGLYNFEVDGKEKREIMQCRFTFNWRKEPNGEWKVLHYHSSIEPKDKKE